VIGVCTSVLLEIVLSALYAPVLMLIQSRYVFEIIMGRDSGWKTQRREGGGSWAEAWAFHKKHMLIACVTATTVWFLSPALLAWVSPALLGLFLSVLLSRASGSETIGRWLSSVALLRTPEEMHRPALVRRRAELLAMADALPADGLHHLARDTEARAAHVHGNLERAASPRGQPDANLLTAQQKLKEARTLEEALDWLTPLERVQVAGDGTLLDELAALPDAPKPAYII
jgi:membrane glycosyltransferase